MSKLEHTLLHLKSLSKSISIEYLCDLRAFQIKFSHLAPIYCSWVQYYKSRFIANLTCTAIFEHLNELLMLKWCPLTRVHSEHSNYPIVTNVIVKCTEIFKYKLKNIRHSKPKKHPFIFRQIHNCLQTFISVMHNIPILYHKIKVFTVSTLETIANLHFKWDPHNHKVLKYSYYNYMNDVLVKSAFPVVSHSGLAESLHVFQTGGRSRPLLSCRRGHFPTWFQMQKFYFWALVAEFRAWSPRWNLIELPPLCSWGKRSKVH